MKSKRFFLSMLCICLSALVLLALPTLYIDPFFHYHAPIEGVSYRLYNERAQNDGILRSFEYDSIIIGASITQNFKTSEFDSLFDAHSVKVPFDGVYLKEINDRLVTAFESGNEIKRVLIALDPITVTAGKDAYGDYDYPSYLYDKNPFNDVAYLFNSDVFVEYTLANIKNTLAGVPSTTFDEYGARAKDSAFGRDKALASYTRPPVSGSVRELSEKELADIGESVEQNLLSLVREHRDTEFLLFIPPRSILTFDSWVRSGKLSYITDVFREVSRMLAGEENARVFCFYEERELVWDLDNYRDFIHYNGEVCSYILREIARDTHRLTAESIDAYFDEMQKYYQSYDYDAIFDQ